VPKITGVAVLSKELIKNPTQRVKGFELPYQEWAILNQIRTGHGMYKRKLNNNQEVIKGTTVNL